MRLLITSFPARGHLNPVLSLGDPRHRAASLAIRGSLDARPGPDAVVPLLTDLVGRQHRSDALRGPN